MIVTCEAMQVIVFADVHEDKATCPFARLLLADMELVASSWSALVRKNLKQEQSEKSCDKQKRIHIHCLSHTQQQQQQEDKANGSVCAFSIGRFETHRVKLKCIIKLIA